MMFQAVACLSVSVLGALQTQEPSIPIEDGRKLASDTEGSPVFLWICLWILGLMLIPFSLALLWKNEKKVVKFH
jgi:hypothetical protein